MTTKLNLNIESAAKIVKPFVGSLATKPENWIRPFLKTALVTEKHVTATNSHYLFRLEHSEKENVESPYLYHYKGTKNLDGVSIEKYPSLERLFPDTLNAKESFTINIKEWIEAHDIGLVAAKESDKKNKGITLRESKLSVNMNKDDEYFNQIGFTYNLAKPTPIEYVRYNCKYMLDILKAFKKLKQTEVTIYFFGPMRPIYFVSEEAGADALLLPILYSTIE